MFKKRRVRQDLSTELRKIVIVASKEKQNENPHFIKKLKELYSTSEFKAGDEVDSSAIYLIMGGDGSLNYLINNISLSAVATVLYLPQGTANDFARSLRLPNVHPHTCFLEDIINYNQIIKIPIRKCNDRLFINVATAGNPAQTTESKGGPFKKLFGKISYYLRGASKLANQDIYDIEIESPKPLKFKTLGFIISQGLYAGGGVKVSTRFTPNFHSELEFLAFDSTEVIETSRGIFEVQKDVSCYDELPLINLFSSKIKLKSSQTVPVKLDGEEYFSNDFIFEDSGKYLNFLRY